MSKPCPKCGRDALGDVVLVHETDEEWHRHCVYDMAFEMRDRALTAEAEVRELREAQGYLLGLGDHWYELWRKASNAVMRLDAELNG